jgi:hypothetical protein
MTIGELRAASLRVPCWAPPRPSWSTPRDFP